MASRGLRACIRDRTCFLPPSHGTGMQASIDAVRVAGTPRDRSRSSSRRRRRRGRCRADLHRLQRGHKHRPRARGRGHRTAADARSLVGRHDVMEEWAVGSTASSSTKSRNAETDRAGPTSPISTSRRPAARRSSTPPSRAIRSRAGSPDERADRGLRVGLRGRPRRQREVRRTRRHPQRVG